MGDQDLHDIESLLIEIPNATSASPNAEESVRGNSLKVENGKSSPTTAFPNYYNGSHGLGTSPSRNSSIYGGISFERPNAASTKLFQSSFDQKHEMNGNPDGTRMTVKNNSQTPMSQGGVQDSSNHSEDQPLASSFTQFSFKNNASEGQHPGCVKQPMSGLVPGSMNGSPPSLTKSLNGLSLSSPRRSSLDRSNMEVNNGHKTGNSHKFEELKKKKNRHGQPLQDFDFNVEEPRRTVPMYSTSMPLDPSLSTFPVISSVPTPDFDYSTTPYQQPYFLNAQSAIPCIHPQELSQSHLAWRYMEEERYYRMQQQYLHLQQFQNQGFIPQVEENGNSTVRAPARTLWQPRFDMPVQNEAEQENKVPSRNGSRKLNAPEYPLMGRGCHCYVPDFYVNGENCSVGHEQRQTSMNPSIYSSATHSVKDFEAVQVLDKMGKHAYPEKLLTRSHGLNSLRYTSPGSISDHELQNHANTGGRLLGDAIFRHQLSMPNTGSFQLRDCSGDVDIRHGNSRIQPQKFNSLDEVAGRIYKLAKDQNGARFLQRRFIEGTTEDINKIFCEIIDHIVELMTDSFGNYLVQKLLEVCSETQRMQILRAITKKPGDLVKISSDMHGTRAVQKVIETLKSQEQFSMVFSSLKPGIVSLIKDPHGNHVAQRCLQHLMPQYSGFLFEAVTAHCFELATDRHGCCVLQKCLSNSDFEQKRRLICEVTSNALILSQDPFGNYVVQFILELEVPWATADALSQLDGNYGNLSMQKYSSNVVEKCLKYGGEERRTRIIKELISNSSLDQILLHPYGNYVIQAALNSSKGALHAALVEVIDPHVPALKTSPFGKKVLSCYSRKK
ncbi:pumilio homolog 2-like [Papaver somniferum]|uniref:pumilio homolog 2-like n=1 Tax=Papaver somniferum TaxID=3469 RepID=UPI000E700FE3|nr:pumilio homolog 2-like [Papaver somniferum]XP_026425913.1 pumilio homolog 2-like [Papaver somniferum]